MIPFDADGFDGRLDAGDLSDTVIDLSDLSITDGWIQRYNERMERELHGAWRAGFDYLHVYRDPPNHSLARGTFADRLTFAEYVLPSKSERPPEPDGLQYQYTYDIGSVPDHVIRSAVRGKLDKYERINHDR